MSPEERQQAAFDNGVSWGRFKERLESSENTEWLRKRVLSLVDWVDLVTDRPLTFDEQALLQGVVLESVRDRLTEEE
jgi:hypothetical protein